MSIIHEALRKVGHQTAVTQAPGEQGPNRTAMRILVTVFTLGTILALTSFAIRWVAKGPVHDLQPQIATLAEKGVVSRRRPDPVWMPVSQVSLVLNGIAWDSVEPYALISGEVVVVGDRVADAQVQEIHPKHVVLTQGKNRMVLKIP
jgi:hypothetical protein